MGAPNEFTLDDVKAELKKWSDNIKEVGEKALAQADKNGKVAEGLKNQIDEMLPQWSAANARLLELEQKAARRGTEEHARGQTIGEQVAQSEEFKEWRASGGMRSPNSGFLFTIKAAITSTLSSDTTTVGVRPDEQPLLPGLQRRLHVRDLLTPGTTDSNSVSYVKETGYTNNAATVSEGDKKPESTLTYDWVQSPVVTVAHYIKASKQILDDFKGLQSQIDGRMREGLKLKEEDQLLKGSGVGNNLNGVYTQATAFSAPIVLPGAPSKIDIIRLMILQAELADLPSTGIVLHPSDWAAIELTKDANFSYIFANPQSLASPMLWGLPVVSTKAMTVDTALVGAFRMGAQIFDREEINVVIATQNEDDFVRNIITIRCEERLALAVYRPEAFIKNTNLPAS